MGDARQRPRGIGTGPQTHPRLSRPDDGARTRPQRRTPGPATGTDRRGAPGSLLPGPRSPWGPPAARASPAAAVTGLGPARRRHSFHSDRRRGQFQAAALRTRQSPRAPTRPRGGAANGSAPSAHARRPPTAEGRIIHSGQWEPRAGGGPGRWGGVERGTSPAGGARGRERSAGCAARNGKRSCKVTASGRAKWSTAAAQRTARYSAPLARCWEISRGTAGGAPGLRARSLLSCGSASSRTSLVSDARGCLCRTRGETISTGYLHCTAVLLQRFWQPSLFVPAAPHGRLSAHNCQPGATAQLGDGQSGTKQQIRLRTVFTSTLILSNPWRTVSRALMEALPKPTEE